jgi:hypothetical protein
MSVIRKCEKCGHVDDRQTWSSADEAADKGAFDGWACPMCAWTEFELVETDQPAAASAG